MFSDSREAKLSAGAFGFRCNPQRKKNHELARVHVNPEDMAPLKLTMNRGKGALRARSVTAASPPFCQT